MASPSSTGTGTADAAVLVARLGSVKFEGASGEWLHWTADGRTIVVGSRQGVEVWDVETGARRRPRISCGHKSVWGMAVAPAGSSVATVGFDGGVRVHDLVSGDERLAVPVENRTIAVAFSPDEKLLAYAVQYEPKVHLVDAITGEERHAFPLECFTRHIEFSRDGRSLAVGDGDVELLDVATGKRTLKVRAVSGGTFALSPDTKVLALVNQGRLPSRIVDVATGRDLVPPIEQPPLAYHAAVAFSRDGARVALCFANTSNDAASRVVHLVDLASGGTKTLAVDSGYISGLAFSPDGEALATVNGSGVRVWSIPEGRDLARTGHERSVDAAAFSSDGALLATGSEETICLWRTADWRPSGRLPTKSERLAFRPDGVLVNVRGSTVVELWDPVKRELQKQSRCELADALLGELAPGARWLVVGSARPEIARFDVESGRRLWCVAPGVASEGGRMNGVLPMANAVFALAVAPDEKTIAAAFMSGELLLLDEATGRTIRALSRRGEPPLFLRFSTDGRTLAAQKGRDAIELWDVAAGTHLRDLQGVESFGAAFTRKWDLLATRTEDETVKLTSVATGASRGHARAGSPSRAERPDPATVLEWDPTGTLLVAGHLLGTVRVWRLAP